MLVTDGIKKPLSTALYYGLRSLPIKALFSRQLAQPMRGNKALQPEKFRPEIEVVVRHSAASSITTIHSLSPKARSDAHIIYLRGRVCDAGTVFSSPIRRKAGNTHGLYGQLAGFPLAAPGSMYRNRLRGDADV